MVEHIHLAGFPEVPGGALRNMIQARGHLFILGLLLGGGGGLGLLPGGIRVPAGQGDGPVAGQDGGGVELILAHVVAHDIALARIQPVLSLLADGPVAPLQDGLEAGGEVSGRHQYAEAAGTAEGSRLQAEELIRPLGKPGLGPDHAGLHVFLHILPHFLQVLGRDGQLLVGIGGVVIRGMMQAVRADGPGMLDVHHQPHGSAGGAPVLVAHIAGEVFVLLNIRMHMLDHIQSLRGLRQDGGIVLVLGLGFPDDPGLGGIRDDDAVADLPAQALDTVGYRSEGIHGTDPF